MPVELCEDGTARGASVTPISVLFGRYLKTLSGRFGYSRIGPAGIRNALIARPLMEHTSAPKCCRFLREMGLSAGETEHI